MRFASSLALLALAGLGLSRPFIGGILDTIGVGNLLGGFAQNVGDVLGGTSPVHVVYPNIDVPLPGQVGGDPLAQGEAFRAGQAANIPQPGPDPVTTYPGIPADLPGILASPPQDAAANS
ncbi:hypothetical protein N658DRAFT_345761 [Parathielavia hyrcaniae]|uniref:Uncharacterized protein n=1 Tax=Parathielavia hyrcaniae TaxID=113614 RepID=A0AAN6PRZ9_9PEZI|nr:hypothetical protein N658DRAFT_345761 [Parathielavia hyrcaniae]